MSKMKVLVESEEPEGLEGLMGERITMYCSAYIYTGKLVGVSPTCAKLVNAAIVYETGPYDEKEWKDAQALPGTWYVMLQGVESFGKLK